MPGGRIPPLDLEGSLSDARTGRLMDLGRQLLRTVNEIITRVGGAKWTAIPLPVYTVSTLPTSGIDGPSLAYCSNESGGATVVFWDGSNWRRVQDRNIAT